MNDGLITAAIFFGIAIFLFVIAESYKANAIRKHEYKKLLAQCEKPKRKGE